MLSVTNTGPVVPPSEVDRLFQPFQHLDGRRVHHNGHGLGLSIVKAIATAHGATVAASAPPGGGLSVEITFPTQAGAGTTLRDAKPLASGTRLRIGERVDDRRALSGPGRSDGNE